jgi:hypothetical protein
MDDLERGIMLSSITKQPFRQAMMHVYEVDRTEDVEPRWVWPVIAAASLRPSMPSCKVIRTFR